MTDRNDCMDEEWTPDRDPARRDDRRPPRRPRNAPMPNPGLPAPVDARRVMISLEVYPNLLEELRQIGEREGVNSVYHMIRKACYEYIDNHGDGRRRGSFNRGE